MDLTKNHGIDINSWYIIIFTVQTWTHGIDMDSQLSIGILESHTYKRDECCPYAGFLFVFVKLCICSCVCIFVFLSDGSISKNDRSQYIKRSFINLFP